VLYKNPQDSLVAALVLSDGSVFFGKGFGCEGTYSGELVFNTSMTGYQEALTDPSYAGQVLTMTYPLIGNYGINPDDFESLKVHVSGFVVRQLCREPHHYKSDRSVSRLLLDHGIGGIEGIDTRAVVRKIRTQGVMPCSLYVGSNQPDLPSLLQHAKKDHYSAVDFVGKVTQSKTRRFGKGAKSVVLIDCGAKYNIVRELVTRGLEVIVVPAYTDAKTIKDYSPSGIVVSNGPGDPELLGSIAATVKSCFDFPMLGICLGHQIIGKAAGAKTFKLKFGHRGSNHPVLDIENDRVMVTTQNHGYAIDISGLSKDFKQTHINCNDNTNEGIAHKSHPIFSVQYHPEACPGPQDSKYLFDKFVKSL